MNIFIYIFCYYLILLSIIGFGYLFEKIVIKDNELVNFGYLGIYGLFSLTLLSYISNLIIPHNTLFNFSIIFFGISSFIFFLKKNFPLIKKDFKILIFLSIVFIFFIIGPKNYDDFSYYHFPYIHLLTQESLLIGIGNFNLGFRTHSSIFYLGSLFNLPLTNFYLIHLSSVFFMVFANFILLKKTYNFFEKKKNVNTTVFSLLIFAFINIFFYRMGEHGTDKSAQILIFLVFLIVYDKFLDNFKIIDKKNLTNFVIILSLAITLKPLYFLYSLIFFIVFFNCSEKKKIIITLFTDKYLYFSLALIFLFLAINFFNTGCILYPLDKGCFPSFSWTIPADEVKTLNLWYEQWSKAGAAPNFRVENPEIYIQNLNWLSNWFKMYFLNKVSDFLLGLFFLLVIFYKIFGKKRILKNRKENNKKYFFLLFLILLFLFEWFFKHPSLRYGGYHLFGLLFFLIFIIFMKGNFQITKKKITIWVSIVFLIFISRNLIRMNKEFNEYNQNLIKNASYNKQFKNMKIYERLNILMNCNLNFKSCLNDPLFYENRTFFRKIK
jgi:hypothetical protein